MKISFVIPAYNEGKNIWACINSVQGELSRNPDIRGEVIVVDNGSTDRTGQIAVEAGADLILEPNKGVVRARQAGFEHSKGEFVAFIDADNTLPLNWLRKVLQSFIDPNTVAVSGPLVYDLPMWFRVASKVFYMAARVSHKFFVMLQGGNFVVRRTALIAAGGLDLSYEFYGEDIAQAIRLSSQGQIKFCPELWAWSSGRRFVEDGVLTTTTKYITSYVSAHLLGRPILKNYNDIR